MKVLGAMYSQRTSANTFVTNAIERLSTNDLLDVWGKRSEGVGSASGGSFVRNRCGVCFGSSGSRFSSSGSCGSCGSWRLAWRIQELRPPRYERLGAPARGRVGQTSRLDDLLRDGVLCGRFGGQELWRNRADDFAFLNGGAKTLPLLGPVRREGMQRFAQFGRAEAAAFVLVDEPENAGRVETVEYVARVDPSSFGDFRFRSQAIDDCVDDATNVFEAVCLRNILAFEASASCRHVGGRSLHAEGRSSSQKFGPRPKVR